MSTVVGSTVHTSILCENVFCRKMSTVVGNRGLTTLV